MVWDTIIFVATVAVGSSVITTVVGLRRQRAAERVVAVGAAPAVFAAIRRLGRGPWRGRWRHGLVTVMPAEIGWRPRRPRPGPPIRLTNVRIHGTPRRQLWYEHWWLAAGVGIYRLSGEGGGEYELAVVAESVRLFEEQICRPREGR
jgi:hypothetical protein